ncbi:hypothetical protein FOL47_008096 [Perkinsus chesapeaki]|uniref:Peptidase A1 domain-containing protein n=1 Tax=Perkinsus chesapeaki TaxID=330153 RepID=A0A7J6LH23_PERCH|nr:hypothetical protein FOL47_008096 [Perkinsus chesapeaki]
MNLYTSLARLVYILIECNAGSVLRQSLTRSFITDKTPRGFGLYTAMIADGQEMKALVDTGSSYLLWVWKTQYEKVAGRGACDKLFFKCYECLWPCHPTEYNLVDFGGATLYRIFEHSGSVNFGNVSLHDITFGLIGDFSPYYNSPYSLLGMGPSIDDKYPSFLKQLMSLFPTPINGNVFGLYLRAKRPRATEYKGELILGGGDRSLYRGPLSFVPTVRDDSWRVELSAVELGETLKVAVADTVLLDTGCNYIYVPPAKLNELLGSIEQAASSSAKKEVRIEYEADYGVWEVKCKYRKYMPTLHFMLATPTGGVPLSISSESYVPVSADFCYLQILASNAQQWQLPDFVLIGNYLEFQPDKKRVGIAVLK